MFLDTIYKEDFHNFLKNPTDFILSGVVMNENEKGYYYRFIRVPMADGEHSVEALFGQMCSNYPTSMSKDHFLEQHNLEFMAYVVDHEKTYAESYEFLRLFDATSAYTGPHSAMGEMTKTLWDYLEQKTILDPDYLNTPELQNEAYENAVKQYVLQKKDTAFEETLWSSWKTLSFPTTNRSSMWLRAAWKLWGFRSRRVITTQTTSPPLMCQSSSSASITSF